MIGKLLAVATLLLATRVLAAVDVNRATVADLDGIKGIGPSLSGRILEARRQGEFRDWHDLMARVKGVRANNAARLSDAGLTVGGMHYQAPEKAVAKVDPAARAQAREDRAQARAAKDAQREERYSERDQTRADSEARKEAQRRTREAARQAHADRKQAREEDKAARARPPRVSASGG